MNAKAEESNLVDTLIDRLADKEPAVRETSRNKLIELGGPEVTRALVMTLIHPRPRVRWEAAKALQAIADPAAAPALMHAMDDEENDVRWVAAEGLIALDDVGLRMTLSGLMKRAASIEFCKSAHHVLHEIKQPASIISPVLRALEESEPAVAAPPAAYQALLLLNEPPAAG